MALVLKRLCTGYVWLFNEVADPRAKEYVFLNTPLQVISVIGAYFYFVLVIGPKFMENRKPFNLKPILVVYNLSQIIFNAIILFRIFQMVLDMNLDCNPVDYTQSDKGILAIRLVYSYYLLKLYDMLDTVFIIFKKNLRQASFLHIYHHAGMVIVSYVGLNFVGGGEALFTGLFNTIVHSIMYSYYLLSIFDTKWKTTSMKKIVTELQLVQFVVNILIYGRLFFKADCSFPRFIPFVYVPQNVFMLALFGDFYRKTYLLNKPKQIKSY